MILLKLSPVFLFIFCVLLERTEEASLNAIEDQPNDNILVERLSFVGEGKKTVILTKGKTIKLECQFTAGPWSYVQWLKLYFSEGIQHEVVQANQTYLNGSSLLSSIVLDDVSGMDEGNYSCIYTTSSGSEAFEFNVAVKDKVYCQENHCVPHGRCIELLSGYECNCDVGYIGESCELKDVCIPNPCTNNGTCSRNGVEFNCSCAQGFGGENCEREVCVQTSCGDGGSCSEIEGGKIKCSCGNDHAGERCQYRCTFSPYRMTYNSHSRYGTTGKTCVIRSNGIERCRYHSHANTNFCMMESDIRNECADTNICNGRGSCTDYTYGYKCTCNRYSSGNNCEFYNECSAQKNLCRRNGGTCVDLVKGYKCIDCPVGQHGDKCEHKSEPCNVACHQQQMEPNCDMRFLREELFSVPIYLNDRSCRFQDGGRNIPDYQFYNSQFYQRRTSFSYSSCGTEVQYEDDYVIYRNSLKFGEPDTEENENDVITRNVGYFLFEMECRIPLLRKKSSSAVIDLTLSKNETTHLKVQRNVSITTSVAFYKENWQNRLSKYAVGDRLFVKLYLQGVSNRMVRSKGVLNPDTCYATSDRLGTGPRYTLIEDRCIKDKTFRFESEPQYRSSSELASYFSFLSFSFKQNPGKLYLHCEARLCINQTDHLNATDYENCNISCRKQKVEEDTPISSESANSTLPAPSQTESRDKRSLGVFDKLLGLAFSTQHDIIERESGLMVELLGGHGFA